NSIYTLTVASVDDRGLQADYSEPGANVLISAPSGSGIRESVISADLTGVFGYNDGFSGDLSDPSYTEHFSGTSAAAPHVAGAVALMLEANPQLGWRDVMEILLRTARKTAPAD